MKKLIVLMTLVLTAMTAAAQEEILEKYKKNGDVTTFTVSKNMLDRVPADMLNLPGIDNMLDKLDKMTILTAKKITNIAKKMRTQLPKQLAGCGFKQTEVQKLEGATVTFLQSKSNPNNLVLIIDNDNDPRTAVVHLICREGALDGANEE